MITGNSYHIHTGYCPFFCFSELKGGRELSLKTAENRSCASYNHSILGRDGIFSIEEKKFFYDPCDVTNGVENLCAYKCSI